MKLLPLLFVGVLLLAGCGEEGAREAAGPGSWPSPGPTSPAAVPMPDLVGLPSATAGNRLGRLELSSSWGGEKPVRCEQRPRTVSWQRPAPGTPLRDGVEVRIRTAALDLDRFRGPCEPEDGDLGPLTGPDAVLARDFYRFAADPSLGAPFVGGPVWVGIEDGLFSTTISGDDLPRLSAWELETDYAERSGPFTPLDILASSGGYYELRRGVDNTCFTGDAEPPAELTGVRAISLTVPSDVTSSCMEWWGVTLFLDAQDRIAGVALRLGSP